MIPQENEQTNYRMGEDVCTPTPDKALHRENNCKKTLTIQQQKTNNPIKNDPGTSKTISPNKIHK